MEKRRIGCGEKKMGRDGGNKGWEEWSVRAVVERCRIEIR